MLGLLGVSFCVFLAGMVSGHTYHTGKCPSVEPMSDFSMQQFLGIWYAIQKTATASTCLVYNITLGEEPGEYKIDQTSQHFALGLTPLKHEYSYTGIITVPDNDIPSKMKVKFPLSVAGSSSFTVFASDYQQYAGIYSCQRLGFAHRRSATLLSRTRTLDKLYLDKMRNKLSTSSIDPFDLSIIDQIACPKNASEGVNIHIDDETFSAQSVASVIRKAGEKIGDGFEAAVGAGKKIYHKIRDNGDDDSSTHVVGNEQPEQPVRGSLAREVDAEWVRF